MLVRSAGRCAAVLVVLAGAVTIAPAAGAQGTAAGAGSSAAPASVSASASMSEEASARFLSTPRGDPMPPPDARRYASRYLATAPVDDGVPERIAGADRYATAAQVARQFGTANAVIVANGTNKKNGFDALSANYLAGQLDAPIVLTGGAALEPETAAAVKAVLAGSTAPQIFVMGKEDSVSAAVVDALNVIAGSIAGAGGEYVQRVAGDTRYATSALSATAAGDELPGAIGFGSKAPLPTAILASGTSNADALAAGPLSHAWGMPVLLTAVTQLSPEIAATITDLGIKQLIVLGGTDRVSDAVVAKAQAAGAVRVQRVAGANRFATAAQLYTLARTTFAGPDGGHYADGQRVFVANGVTGFPDALAVGPLAAKLGAPLLTVAAASVDKTTFTYLNSAKQTLSAVTVLGATATVGHVPMIALKSAAGINILAGSDGTIAPADDADAQFQAAAATLTSFEAKLELARSYLPNKGAGIGTLYPYMLSGWDAAGLTEFGTCDVWMDNTLSDDQLLDIFRHEYVHVLQCVADNAGYNPGYVLTSDTAIGGVERGADAGAYLLGNSYMYYVQLGPTAGPLQVNEIVTAQKLLAFSGVTYHIG
jgi:putative cell wall-binding protein